MNYREIIIIRHGKPLSAHNEVISVAEFAQWVRQYNRSELHPESHPSQVIDLKHHRILTSKLKRARLSAERYTDGIASEPYAVFNEMDVPWYRVAGKRRAWNWVLLNRAIWFTGRKGPFESFQQARERVREGAALLDSMSVETPRIALFAHALTNRFLVRYLQREGWELTEKDYSFWGRCRLEKREE